ncbi:MAG: MCE family protein [Thermoleophilaceae bacterium]|nr:MCE family protein [Thermoleophilaceae bacterium]
MPKQAPSFGKIATMALFALSCFGLLLFLWLSFGGSVPLKPKSYRLKADIPEATTLAQEADVRISGVSVGKVKTKELKTGADATTVELEIKPEFAPLPRDTRVILRQKTLLGETYVELTPGSKEAKKVPDGGSLGRANVADTVQLDEIFAAFDKDTRNAFRIWQSSLAPSFRGRGQDLNDALGSLPDFLVNGADVLKVLDEQEQAVGGLIKNTGVVFNALTEREGELRQLVVNSNRVFDATASRDEALEDTIRTFPTFLDESKATLSRLEDFSTDTRPLVRDLMPVADDISPTIRDVAGLAPDLRRLFRDLDPLIRAGRTGLPATQKIIEGAEPLLAGLYPFLQELNPIVSFANFQQKPVAGFFLGGPATINGGILTRQGPDAGVPKSYLRGYGLINGRSFDPQGVNRRPAYDRGGSAYGEPNHLTRAQPIGAVESFSCLNNVGTKGADAQGEQSEPTETPTGDGLLPCKVKPPTLFNNGGLYPRLQKGFQDLVPPPDRFAGRKPATPPGTP